MKKLFILSVLIFFGCSPRIKAPDSRDLTIRRSDHIAPELEYFPWHDSRNYSFERMYISPSDHGEIYSAVLRDSTYEISDSSGLLAERINGKWKIYDCTKALEVFYKIDSARQYKSVQDLDKDKEDFKEEKTQAIFAKNIHQ